METNFTLEQLSNPDIAESESILRKCVHCGFCNATCPTHVVLGDELDSPRGRIYLIKEMLEKAKPASNVVVKHLDRCLSCLSCMTTCPSGVNYMHLVDHARSHIEATYRRDFSEEIYRFLLSVVLPRPLLFRYALVAAMLAQPFRLVMPKRWQRAISMVPWSLPSGSALNSLRLFPKRGKTRLRVGLLPGCVQQILAPNINDATIRLLSRMGCEVVITRNTGCCGALNHHLGKTSKAKTQAQANIEDWAKECEDNGLDAIVVNASGCGTMVKEYAHLFRNSTTLSKRANLISKLTYDVSELLERLGYEAAIGNRISSKISVAYHSPCSLQHGQNVKSQPQNLLSAAGFSVTEIPENHICCGSAGTYNLLQPKLSEELLQRKIANVGSLTPDFIATGNIGCITQLSLGTDIPVLHTVELLDWAHGGPKPIAIPQAYGV